MGVEVHGTIPLKGRLEFQVDGRTVVGRIIGRSPLDIAVQLDDPPTIRVDQPIQTQVPATNGSLSERGDWTALSLMAQLAREEWNKHQGDYPPPGPFPDTGKDTGKDPADDPELEDLLEPEGQPFFWIDDELRAKLEGYSED